MRPEAAPTRTKRALPTGVPRPPTSSRTRTLLRPTQPCSAASGQTPVLLLVEDTPSPPPRSRALTPPPPARATSCKRTTPSGSPSPRSDRTPTRCTTTPRGDPPLLRHRTAERVRPPYPVPVDESARGHDPGPRDSLLSPSPRKRPRLRPAASPCATLSHFPPALEASVGALLSTDFAALDPASTYRLDQSLLFRFEYLNGGAPTVAQGAKRGYGGSAAAHLNATRAQEGARARPPPAPEVPTWARTDDGTEWQADLLRRLSSRLVAPSPRPGPAPLATAADQLIPLLHASDLTALRGPVRLGPAGGTLECYLLGCEWPVRTAVWTGWVVAKEWRDRENAWAYAVDDGTAVLEVVCPSTSAPSTSSGSGIASIANLPPLMPAADLALRTAATGPPTEKISPRKALAAAQWAHLEARALDQSERVTFRAGACVRVVGRVEERRTAWDPGRRVVALRMDLLDDLDAFSAHQVWTGQLHRTVYSAPFDAQARLAHIERAEREAQQRAWENASCVTASTVGGPGGSEDSEWGARGGGSVASSPAAKTHYRPTRPSRLAREDLTLSNLIIYVRHHLRRRYLDPMLLPAAGGGQFPTSPFAGGGGPFSSFLSPSSDVAPFERARPFTLGDLAANKHLAMFATRLAREQARVGVPKSRACAAATQVEADTDAEAEAAAERGVGVPGRTQRAWVAAPSSGDGGRAHRVARGRVGQGAARLLFLPPPSASSSSATAASGVVRETRIGAGPAAPSPPSPLDDPEELRRAAGRVWREAIRSMRRAGMIVEAATTTEGEAAIKVEEEEDPRVDRGRRDAQFGAAFPQKGRYSGMDEIAQELPDLPRHAGGRIPPPPPPPSTPPPPRYRTAPPRGAPVKEETTPRARVQGGVAGGAFGCPWGDVKLFGSDDDGEESGRERKVRSGGRGAAQPDPDPLGGVIQAFELVTPGTLAPQFRTLLDKLYTHRRTDRTGAGGGAPSSVTERELRRALYQDERWAAVAQFSEAVGKALELLGGEGLIERHGQGWRPVGARAGNLRTARAG